MLWNRSNDALRSVFQHMPLRSRRKPAKECLPGTYVQLCDPRHQQAEWLVLVAFLCILLAAVFVVMFWGVGLIGATFAVFFVGTLAAAVISEFRNREV